MLHHYHSDSICTYAVPQHTHQPWLWYTLNDHNVLLLHATTNMIFTTLRIDYDQFFLLLFTSCEEALTI
jgi:hypothetical protein